jgi:5-(carboxyamino)imidazole ribonucleotide synthase
VIPPGFIPPGSTLGILGGGQLGRMLAQAAAKLGYRCHIFCPETDSPAGQVAPATVAAYDDLAALDAFAAAVDVVTFEFENIPVAAVERVAARRPTHPNAAVLRVTQDRLLEKDFVRRRGARTVAYRAVDSAADLAAAVAAVGAPAILKTRRMGYDGKGQAAIADPAGAAAAWTMIGGAPAILEARFPFVREISLILARGLDGAIAAYDPVENRHRDGILATSTVPAAITPATAAAAEAIARSIADGLGIVGVLAVEMFVGGDGAVLINELAPRVHNSGHWTIEGAAASQFEQHVRAICGLPLGSPRRLANATMTNLIGDEVNRWRGAISEPNLHLHLYGKREARPGRKMGHVTRLYPLDTPPPTA